MGIRVQQYEYDDTFSYWLLKEDEAIQKAHEALDQGDFDAALELYEIAISENPEHVYLKNNLLHLQYKKAISADSLIKQNERFEGQYGQREFWIEDGKFFYKRQGENVDLPRFELLAIDENRYMDLTRANTIMEFVIDEPTGKLASSSSQYIFDEKKWITSGNSTDTTNYFLKDD